MFVLRKDYSEISVGKYCLFQHVPEGCCCSFKYEGYASKYYFKRQYTNAVEDQYSWFFGVVERTEAEVTTYRVSQKKVSVRKNDYNSIDCFWVFSPSQ